jgi:hypothetical protein
MANTLRSALPNIEILSPENTADTRENVLSVREIAIVHSTRALAVFLQRGQNGDWPEETDSIGPDGTLSFESVDFGCPLSEVYADTPLGDEEQT